MLVLTRNVGEEIVIGNDIHITVVAVKGEKVRLGVTAPKDVVVDRGEVHESRKQHFLEGGNEMGFSKELFGGTAIDYLGEGKTFLEGGHFHDAIEAFAESIRLNPIIADAYFYRGNAYSAENDYGHAITDYGKAIKINPNLTLAYHNRGLAFLKSGNLAGSKADQEQAFQLDPNVGSE
jgi:carbon storage regulator CsrA